MPGKLTSKWYRRAARFGLCAKGVVYCLSGALALFAATGTGHNDPRDAGKKEIFGFLRHQPMGKWVLAVIALGLLCYAFWRVMQGARDTEHKGKDKKGLARRTTYFSSGFVYASLALYCIKMVMDMGGKGQDARQAWVTKLLHQPFGKWMVIAVAAAMICTGIYQVYRAMSGKYKKYIRTALDKNTRPWVMTAGIAGYTARGIVWLVIGWLFIKAAIQFNPKVVGGSDAAFSWLEDASYKGILLGFVAFGLVCYGIFMFLRARYQPIHVK